MCPIQLQLVQIDQPYVVFIKTIINYLFAWKYQTVFDLVKKSPQMSLLHLVSFLISGAHVGTGMSNGIDSEINNNHDHSLDSTTQQHSLYPSDIEHPSDDDYTTIDTLNNQHQHQPIKLAES